MTNMAGHTFIPPTTPSLGDVVRDISDLRTQRVQRRAVRGAAERAEALAPIALAEAKAKGRQLTNEENIQSVVLSAEQFRPLILERIDLENILRSAQPGDDTTQISQSIADNQQNQDQFLQNRMVEILERGGDFSDTNELLAMGPAARITAVGNALKIGRDRGIIARPTAAKAPTAPTTKQVIDNVTGEATFATNEQIQADPARFAPVPTKSPSTVVNIGGKAFEKAAGKADVAERTLIKGTIRTNNNVNADLNKMTRLVKKLPKESVLTGTGKFSSMVLTGGQLLKKMGFDLDGLSEAEQIQSINLTLAVQSRIPGSGTFTDKDQEIGQKRFASLGDTREGFEAKIKLKQASIKYENRLLKMQSNYIDANKSSVGLLEATDAWREKNSFEDVLDKALGEFKPAVPEAPAPSPGSRGSRKQRQVSGRFSIKEL